MKKGTTEIGGVFNGTTEIASIYKGTLLVYEGFKTLIAQGVPPISLQKCANKNLVGYQVYGNSIQNGTPSVDNPVEIQSVGDLVTDSQDEHYGEYKIPVSVTDTNNITTTTNIYLSEPLRKVGKYIDYIDFENSKVVRNVKHLELNISNMNNTENYPGWKNQTYLRQYFPGVNTRFTNFTSVLSNTNTSAIALNTSTASNATVYFTTALHKTQTQLKEDYPDLVYKLDYGIPESEEDLIELPNILLNAGTNVVDIETSVTPSNLWLKYKGKE